MIPEVKLRTSLKFCFIIVLFAIFCCYWWMGKGPSHMMASPFIVNATAKHTATVIFLHGLGDTGQGWSQHFQMLAKPYIKYVCPTANVMPVSLNHGMPMPSWFDIFDLDANAKEDEKGIKAASDILQHYIEEEVKAGIPRSRIVVGGFSQGGAVALHSALANPQESVAGIVGLSTWMPLHKKLKELKANQNTPILQCHGEADPLVQYTFGQMTAALLSAHNQKHTFKSYPGLGHSSSEQEMADVMKFLDSVLPKTD